MVLLDKVKDDVQREWYAKQSIENGWSRDVLVHQIDAQLYQRQATAHKTTNFRARLPDPQSELALQTLKDSYLFDFIERRQEMPERTIEAELIGNITKFLLELGAGFSFVGNQYHLEVEGEDFYIDQLFYHLKLRCFVVIELKVGDFRPEYAGKLNFYISAVDDVLKAPEDKPTIGILLCRNKKGLVAEYSLKDIEKPIGVSEYRLFSTLPEEYEDLLPSAEDILNRVDFYDDAQGASEE